MYRRFALAAIAGLALLLLGAAGVLNTAQAAPPADAFARANFERVWTRTDWLVKFAGLSRAWYWGPDPRRATYEVFDEAPGHIRLVQYFDKSRMEPNVLTGQPTPEPNSKWAVTNGLLVVELIAGQQQLGAARFVPTGPATSRSPPTGTTQPARTYTTFRRLSNTPAEYHPADDHTSAPVIALITGRDGSVRGQPHQGGL